MVGIRLALTYTGPFRFIYQTGLNGSLNMAIDETLAESASAGAPVVRFYTWKPATVSSGRFQKTATLNLEKIHHDGLGYVRRPTGGQGVLHDQELTYSVCLSKKHFDRYRKRETYRFLSTILVRGMELLGVDAAFNLERSGNSRNPNCFATTGEYEVVTNGGQKLIGSAQTTNRESCLQHGSIPLDGSFRRVADYLDMDGAAETTFSNTEPTSIAEARGASVTMEEVSRAFRRAFAETVGIEDDHLTAEETQHAQQLAREKYSQDIWNLRY